MNIVTRMIVLGGLIALVGCNSGPKPKPPEPKAVPTKAEEKPLPPPQTRITPDQINEFNSHAKAEQMYQDLQGQLSPPQSTSVAER